MTFAEAQNRLKQYPALQAMRFHSNQSLALSEQALSLPDPFLTLGINNFPLGGGGFDAFVPTNKSLQIVQNIPNSASRRSQSQFEIIQAEIWQLKYQQELSNLNVQLIKALACLQRINKQEKLFAKENNFLNQEANYWQGKLESGENTLAKKLAINAKQQTINIHNTNLRTLSIEQKTILTRLIGHTQAIKLPPLNIPSIALDNSLLNQLAELSIKQAEAQLQLAKAAYKPSMNISLTYKQRENGDSFAGNDFVSAQVGFSLPLWAKQNQDKGLRAARQNLAAFKAYRLDILKLQQQKLADLTANYAANIKKEEFYNQQIKAYQEQLDALESTYQSEGQFELISQTNISKFTTYHELAKLIEERWAILADINGLYPIEMWQGDKQ